MTFELFRNSKVKPQLQLLCSAVLLFLVSSCNFQSDRDQDWVVNVQNHYLLRAELAEWIPDDMSPEDSMKMADAYINKWLQDHVVLVQAELNLPAELTDFERQLRDYRNSLVVYAFETELIKQKLDTVVSQKEIQQYYKENPGNFQLRDYIVRVNFIKVPSDAPKLSEVEQWITNGTYEELVMLEDYSKQFAEFGFFNEERWLYLDDVLQQIPLNIGSKEQLLQQNKLVKLDEANYLYLLKIIDYKLKDSLSPLALVSKDIRNIIINKRKREFILQMRKDLLESAHKNNEIEYNR